MLSRLILAAALAAPVVDLPQTRTAATPQMRTYVNARFRFRVTWPARVLEARGESDNSDGQTFIGEGAEFRVYGAYMVVHDTLREAYDAELAARGDTVQYRRLTATFFVVSGVKDGRIYYRKVLVASGDRQLVLDAEYDEPRRTTYDPVVRDMARSLAAL